MTAFAVLLLAVVLAGCGTSTRPPLAGTTSTKTVALLYPHADEYFHLIWTGFQQAASNDGSQYVLVNTNYDASFEATRVQQLIRDGVDAIVMQPADTTKGSLQTMRAIRAAGIPLVCYGNCAGPTASEELVDGFAQSDNTSLGAITGKAAAGYAKKRLGGKAVIGILNCDLLDVCLQRKAGFKAALAGSGVDATYVADERAYVAEAATPVATTMLADHPEITLLWAANEGGTDGVVTAVEASKRPVPVFGTDITSAIAESLLDPADVLQATTGQDPVSTAREAYRLAANAMKGQTNLTFEIVVPGIGYSRANPDTVNNYLRQ